MPGCVLDSRKRAALRLMLCEAKTGALSRHGGSVRRGSPGVGGVVPSFSTMKLFSCLVPVVALLFSAQPLAAQVPPFFNYQGRVAVNGINYDGTGLFKFALVAAARTASAEAVVTGGTVSGVILRDGGVGYTSAPTVSFTGGGGAGAAATAIVSEGVVVGINLISGGSGYGSPPAVTLSAPPAGTTTYWSNDNTSAGGSEPTAAVSVPVTKGLYSITLGNPAIANMASFAGLSFNGNPYIALRVWFNDGTHGSQLLSPDQALTTAPFAMASSFVVNAVPQMQVFENSGVFVVPNGVYRVMVELWGGGGGGGGGGYGTGSANGPAGGGGGGGAYIKAVLEDLTPGQALPVTVGAGGSGGAIYTAGATGGASSILDVNAPGGAGGGGANLNGTDGIGGLGGGNFTNTSASVALRLGGGSGGVPDAGVGAHGGMGGGPFPASGGQGGWRTAAVNQANPGSNGAKGWVIIWW